MNEEKMTTKAPRNRTMALLDDEKRKYCHSSLKIDGPVSKKQILNKIINQDIFEAADFLPPNFVDLLFMLPRN